MNYPSLAINTPRKAMKRGRKAKNERIKRPEAKEKRMNRMKMDVESERIAMKMEGIICV